MALVEYINVSKKYGKFEALSNVNITLERGRIIGLLGANGSGKTTIIKLINNLLQPSNGQILINGAEPNLEAKKMISFLPERNYLDLNSSVDGYVKYFSDFYQDFDANKAYDIITKMNIHPSAQLKTLSKGNREKVQLALVMAREVDLYILDEPIGGVDPAARDFIIQTILTNFNENSTLLISTHLIADIEGILDEVIFINEGKILLQKDADEIRNEYNMSIDHYFREEYKCF